VRDLGVVDYLKRFWMVQCGRVQGLSYACGGVVSIIDGIRYTT
jgi:hypothetical protein